MTNITPHDLAVAQTLGELKATGEATLRVVTELKTDTNARIESMKKAIKDDFGGLDERVSVLEAWRYRILGAAAAIGGGVSFIVDHFLK